MEIIGNDDVGVLVLILDIFGLGSDISFHIVLMSLPTKCCALLFTKGGYSK